MKQLLIFTFFFLGFAIVSTGTTEFKYNFSADSGPLEQLKSRPRDIPLHGTKISEKNGVLKTAGCNAFFYEKSNFTTGRISLTVQDQYNSTISLLGRSDKDFSHYYILRIAPYKKKIEFGRYIYGKKFKFREFPYYGSRNFILALDFDGRKVIARVNGKLIAEMPDDGTIKSGHAGIRCEYWTNVTIKSFSATKTIPQEPESKPIAPMKTVPNAKLDISRRSWDLTQAQQRKNGTRQIISLNQIWAFQPVANADTLPDQSPGAWGYFVVPGMWAQGATSNFMHTANGTAVKEWRGLKITQGGITAWYRRDFTIPADWKTKKIDLVLEEVYGNAEIYLNGSKIGGKTDFYKRGLSIDVSSELHFGKKNSLEIKNGSKAPRSVTGLGNIYFCLTPAKNFGKVKISTSVTKKELKLRFISPMAPQGAIMKAVVRDPVGKELFRSQKKFSSCLVFSYIPPTLWTPDSPVLYDLELTLADKSEKILDCSTFRFGFREFAAINGQFLLNGKPIMLKAATEIISRGGWWSLNFLHNREFIGPRFDCYKKLNLNCTYIDSPPTENVLELADKKGIMLLLKGRTFSHSTLDNDAPGTLALLKKELVQMSATPAYCNHPSVIGFLIDVWYGYNAGCTNPNYIGLRRGDPNQQGIPQKRKDKLNRMGALYNKYFPDRVCFTGGSGAVGQVYGTHIYHTWGASPNELRAIFEKWNKKRDMPIFIGETYLPYIGSFYEIDNFHGGGKPLITENAARLFGNSAYQLSTSYSKRPFHDMKSGSWYWNTSEKKKDGRYGFEPDAFTLAVNKYINLIMPGWRFHRLTGIGAFDYTRDALAQQAVNYRKMKFSNNYSDFSFKPEGFSNGNARRPAFDPLVAGGDLRPTLLCPPFQRAMATVSAAIFDKASDPLLLDHSGFSGENMEKSIMIFNDSPQSVNVQVELELRNNQNRVIPLASKTITADAFEHKLLEVKFILPEVVSREEWTLSTNLQGAVTSKLNFPIQVFKRSEPVKLQSALYLYDPEKRLAEKLNSLGYKFKTLNGLQNLPKKGILLVGRKALARGTIPNWSQSAENGLNILIMAQMPDSSPELMKTRTRNVFINAHGHPAFTGLRNKDFSNWRGCSSISPAYAYNAPAGINWSDWGARNMVATWAFRRPQHGNYLSLLVSGFDLFQTPLLEYRSGNGCWIASQLEITDRLNTDPAATRLFNNLLSYMDHTGIPEEVLFFGSDDGAEFLRKFKFKSKRIRSFTKSTLNQAAVLILFSPDFAVLKQNRFELVNFVYQGGKVFYLQQGKEFDSSWLPFTAKQEMVKKRGALVAGNGDGLWRNGWDNNDLYWHDEFTVPVFKTLPSYFEKTIPAVLARGKFGDGEFIFTTLTPERFGNTPAAGKTTRLLSALFTSIGVIINNPVHPYMAASGGGELDLAEQKWEFTTDKKNIGQKEGYQKGLGKARWLKGLIADGIEVRVGQPFESFLRYDYNGYAWYRLPFDAPESLVTAPSLYFVAGAIDDMDEVYLNGIKIGATGKETGQYWKAVRNYPIPPGLLKRTGNLLAVRVIDEKGSGGIVGLPVKISTKKFTVSPRKWQTPYPEGSERDYRYQPDIVRMY